MTMASSSRPLVSVIIPVYNDASRLRDCLDALGRSTYPRERLEVLVIDNGSTDDLDSLKADYSWVLWFYEPLSGSYEARNRGLGEARGQIIGFTDSDCQPSLDWVERGVAALANAPPEVGLIGGAIEVFCSGTNRTPVELYEMLHAFPQRRYVEEFDFAVTANMFVRRQVVEAVGQFDSQLRSGGDHEWGNRARAAGFRLLYVDDVRVRHPARASWTDVNRKLARVFAGARDLHGDRLIRKRRLARQLARSVVPPVRTAYRARTDPRLVGSRQLVKYGWALLVMRYLTAWHLLRSVARRASPR